MRRIAKQREIIVRENGKHAKWVGECLDNITEILTSGRAEAVHHSDSDSESEVDRLREAKRALKRARRKLEAEGAAASSGSATKESEGKTAEKATGPADKAEEEARASAAEAETKKQEHLAEQKKDEEQKAEAARINAAETAATEGAAKQANNVLWSKFISIMKNDACKSDIAMWQSTLETPNLVPVMTGTLVSTMKNGYPAMPGPMCDYWCTPARLAEAINLLPPEKYTGPEITDHLLSVYIRGATHHTHGRHTFVWDVDDSIKGGVLIRMAFSDDKFGITPNGGKWPEDRQGSVFHGTDQGTCHHRN